MKIYLVGGAVRDKLLGLPIEERDWVVVGATPEEMTTKGFRPLDRDFPVFTHPETGDEYALARIEEKTGPGHTGFRVHAGPDVSLEADLKRRDLTVNAMAEAHDGTLIDPFNGREDLDAGMLRHVSRAFIEDPLRILRTARFAARFAHWGFRIAHGTHTLMKRMVRAGEIATLSAERVWQETQRALAADTPTRYFEVLHRCGALTTLIPELDKALGAPAAHPHAGTQESPLALKALAEGARLSVDPVVRYAALMQGMASSDPQAGQARRNPIEAVCRRLRIPESYRDIALLVSDYYADFETVETKSPDEILAILEALDAFRRPDRFERFLTACRAVAADRPEIEGKGNARLRAAHEAALRVDTKDALGCGLAGKALGIEIRKRRGNAIAKALA